MGVLDDAIREHLDLKRRRGADPAEIERAEQDALGPVRRERSAAALSEAEPPSTALPEVPAASQEEFDFEVEADDPAGEHPTTLAPIPAGEEIPAAEEDVSPSGIAAPGYADPDFDEFAVSEAPPAGAEFDFSENEPKHKRRHLFGRRSHEADTAFEERTPLPAELPEDDPFAEELEAKADAPRETAGAESVGRAQPIQRDEPEEPTTPPARPQPPALQITPDAELGHTVEYDVEKALAEEDEEAEGDEDILEETPDFLADTPDHDRLWFEQKPPPDFDFDN
jgi:hypothetical protein